MKCKCLILFLSVLAGLTGFVPQGKASVDLGLAGGFAVLGASEVTSTGKTALTGNLGVSPGGSITGFPPGIVNGTIHQADAAAAQAQADALTAYNTLSGEVPTETLTGNTLGTGGAVPTLTPGVYFFGYSRNLVAGGRGKNRVF